MNRRRLLARLSELDTALKAAAQLPAQPAQSSAGINVLILEGSTGNFEGARGIELDAMHKFVFLPLENLNVNYQGCWDAATNRVRIPVSGAYLVEYRVRPQDNSGGVTNDFYAGPALTTPGDSPKGDWQSISQSHRASASGTVMKHFNEGDMVGLSHYQERGGFPMLCTFSVLLLRADS